MTPEEAREIDRLEFEADCRRVRDSAFAVITQRHGAERARVLRWIGTEPPRFQFVTRTKSTPDPVAPHERDWISGIKAATLTLNGRSMTRRQWAMHLGISLNTLNQRIHRTGSLEAAVALGGQRPRGQPKNRPGVGKNLPAVSGTGGGSTTQDFSEIEFSQ